MSLVKNDVINTTWYTIKVQPNREKTISEKIRIEMEKNNLKDVITTLVPTESSTIMKCGKKYSREKIIYPGYIFVEVKSYGELNHFLKNTDGAVGLLKDRSGEILPIRKSEIDRMLNVVEEKASSNLNIKSGDIVKINHGAFSGFKASISGINWEKNKVNLSVSIFGRLNEIELDVDQVEIFN